MRFLVIQRSQQEQKLDLRANTLLQSTYPSSVHAIITHRSKTGQGKIQETVVLANLLNDLTSLSHMSNGDGGQTADLYSGPQTYPSDPKMINLRTKANFHRRLRISHQ